MTQSADQHRCRAIPTASSADSAASRLLDYRFHAQGSEVTAIIGGTKLHYQLQAMGKHWALASLAALSAAEAVGADLIQ